MNVKTLLNWNLEFQDFFFHGYLKNIVYELCILKKHEKINNINALLEDLYKKIPLSSRADYNKITLHNITSCIYFPTYYNCKPLRLSYFEQNEDVNSKRLIFPQEIMDKINTDDRDVQIYLTLIKSNIENIKNILKQSGPTNDKITDDDIPAAIAAVLGTELQNSSLSGGGKSTTSKIQNLLDQDIYRIQFIDFKDFNSTNSLEYTNITGSSIDEIVIDNLDKAYININSINDNRYLKVSSFFYQIINCLFNKTEKNISVKFEGENNEIYFKKEHDENLILLNTANFDYFCRPLEDDSKDKDSIKIFCRAKSGGTSEQIEQFFYNNTNKFNIDYPKIVLSEECIITNIKKPDPISIGTAQQSFKEIFNLNLSATDASADTSADASTDATAPPAAPAAAASTLPEQSNSRIFIFDNDIFKNKEEIKQIATIINKDDSKILEDFRKLKDLLNEKPDFIKTIKDASSNMSNKFTSAVDNLSLRLKSDILDDYNVKKLLKEGSKLNKEDNISKIITYLEQTNSLFNEVVINHYKLKNIIENNILLFNFTLGKDQDADRGIDHDVLRSNPTEYNILESYLQAYQIITKLELIYKNANLKLHDQLFIEILQYIDSDLDENLAYIMLKVIYYSIVYKGQITCFNEKNITTNTVLKWDTKCIYNYYFNYNKYLRNNNNPWNDKLENKFAHSLKVKLYEPQYIFTKNISDNSNNIIELYLYYMYPDLLQLGSYIETPPFDLSLRLGNRAIYNVKKKFRGGTIKKNYTSKQNYTLKHKMEYLKELLNITS